MINLALYAQTDVGMVRNGNEDNFLILDLSTGNSWTATEEEPGDLLTFSQGYYGSLLAVSDGMGGALAGEVASRMAVETVRDRMLQLQAHETHGKLAFQERLRLSIEEANLLINDESQTNPEHKGLGATFTAIATLGNQIYFAQVGDSRAYLIRQGKIYRITKDQSLVQQLIDAGQITEEEAETHSYRNVILQALGAHDSVNVEVSHLTLYQLDTLVLCSDGLSGKMHQDEILSIVQDASDFKTACQQSIDLANERGGEDNITVVIVQFSGSALPPATDEPVEPEILLRSPDTPNDIDWGESGYRDTASLPSLPQEPPDDDGQSDAPPEEEGQETPRDQDYQEDQEPPSYQTDTDVKSLFAPGELDEGVEAEVFPPSSQAQAQTTAPLHGRPTGPISLTQTQVSGTNTAPALVHSMTNHGYYPSVTKLPLNNSVEKKSSRKGTYILACLLVLAIAGSAIGVTYYQKQREEKSTLQQETQRENQNQKDGKIAQLREKIAEINKKLRAADKPAVKDKRDVWLENLNKLSFRLDEVSGIPSDHSQQISDACDEIGKELKKIEDEVNNLQGLLPSQLTNRQPVKV
ncbi:MAG: protein phosphatase 2C domain-containing protein [Blastocatellia bacterium]|nr:protein phosphatase 2C domain-containing protein [Blastocatellia bacterium]